VLAAELPAIIILDCLDFLRSADRLRLLGFCIMPDHLHLLFVLLRKYSLMELIRDFCRFTARRLNESMNHEGKFWQDDFHDHSLPK
jgi:REP element-mobilizing transposase RayT